MSEILKSLREMQWEWTILADQLRRTAGERPDLWAQNYRLHAVAIDWCKDRLRPIVDEIKAEADAQAAEAKP